MVDLVRKQAAQLQAAEKELRQLRLATSAFEAQELIASAEPVGARKVILGRYENRPVDELRALGNELKTQAGLVALLATFDGKKVVLVAACGPETGLSARELLNRQLAIINGRGGGDEAIAQGGGAATPAQFAAFFDETQTIIQTLI